MTYTRYTSINWGATATLGVTVKTAAGAVLIARTTSGITSLGNGQYGIAIPNWDLSWGACVVVDDGSGTAAGTASSWLDPIAATIPGSVAVNHNTGGTDNLRYLYGSNPVGGGSIVAYLASDYSAGNTSNPQGETTTGPDGRWLEPILLQSGFTYTITFGLQGIYETSTATVTV